MKIFVYVMTHIGDPDEQEGCWGCHDCMGEKRGWKYDAVIGVGGVGAKKDGFCGKVKWIGRTPTPTDVGKKGPEVTFGHFRYFAEGEEPKTPRSLAAKIKRARRGLMSLTSAEQRDAEKLVAEWAEDAPPSEARLKSRSKKSETGSCSSRSLMRHHAPVC